MKGIAPIRRTAQYLDNCGLVFKVCRNELDQKLKTSPPSEPSEDHDCEL